MSSITTACGEVLEFPCADCAGYFEGGRDGCRCCGWEFPSDEEEERPVCCDCGETVDELMCWDCPENSHCEDCCDCWNCDECGKKSYNGQYTVKAGQVCVIHDDLGKGCVYNLLDELHNRGIVFDEDDDADYDREMCRECMVSNFEEYVEKKQKTKTAVERWERLTRALLAK